MGLDWDIERVLTHERNRSTRIEVESAWSLTDLARANLALDVHDEVEARAHAEAMHESQQRAETRKRRS